ncbi:hypothetical protein PFISCL1PPCAC_3415, partial [Pristionchus fissidentatus]
LQYPSYASMPPSLHSSVHFPLGLYSVTSAMFMPIFKSIIYRKACLDLSDVTGITDCDSDNSTVISSNQSIQAAANAISLWSSAAMCIGAILSSMVLGRIGDKRSHRIALLVPLTGLIASDLLLLLQWTQFQSSTLLLVLAEAVFGVCGGYVCILSSSFAYVSVKFENDEEQRSVSIARLEGSIGLGSVVGLLICSQLKVISYLYLFLFCLAVHVICLILVLLMADLRTTDSGRRQRASLWKESFEFLSKSGSFKRPLLILLAAFFACFFAFIGSSNVLLYYLMHRFTMRLSTYSIYRAAEKALSTATALFLFPFLRRHLGVGNVALAAVGMSTRAAAKAWTAIAWSETALFATLLPEAFSRFAASALRSLMAAQVRPSEQGRLFSFVALLEAVCNLLAVVFFHSLFPWSLPIMSELSFVVMAALIVPAIALLWWHRDVIESSKPEISEDQTKMTSSEEPEVTGSKA